MFRALVRLEHSIFAARLQLVQLDTPEFQHRGVRQRLRKSWAHSSVALSEHWGVLGLAIGGVCYRTPVRKIEHAPFSDSRYCGQCLNHKKALQ
jgi:hypothetical protein